MDKTEEVKASPACRSGRAPRPGAAKGQCKTDETGGNTAVSSLGRRARTLPSKLRTSSERSHSQKEGWLPPLPPPLPCRLRLCCPNQRHLQSQSLQYNRPRWRPYIPEVYLPVGHSKARAKWTARARTRTLPHKSLRGSTWIRLSVKTNEGSRSMTRVMRMKKIH